MIDPDAVLRSYLVSQAGLFALTGQRIYAGVDLPAGSQATNQSLLFATRGGPHAGDSGHLLAASVQFRAYADTEIKARQLDRALFDALNDKKSASIDYARLDVIGQLVREPDTGWFYVLSYYRVHFLT